MVLLSEKINRSPTGNSITLVGDISGSGSSSVSTKIVNENLTFILSAAGEVLTTGLVDYALPMHEGGTITGYFVTVGTAPTGAAIELDVLINGATTMSTNITIDATETNSDTAATPYVLSAPTFVKGDRLTFNFIGVGSTVAGADAAITIFYARA